MIGSTVSPVLLLYGGHFDALETNHLPAACPANYIGRISRRPILMINGTEDSDMIKIIWTNGGHGFMSDEQRATMIQWLREHQR